MLERPTIVVVTGGRDRTSVAHAMEVNAALDEIKPSLVVQGGCRGIDAAARDWAMMHETPCLYFPAKWTKHGNKAGPIRNRDMLKAARGISEHFSMNLVLVAFPGGRGTESCIREAKALGIDITKKGC